MSELSNEELTEFLRSDAERQTRAGVPNIFVPSQPICPDLSQYWFAKYELERRKEPSERDTTSFQLEPGDTKESIARRLLHYAFRTISPKYHPDRGGDTRKMQLLIEARDYARERLKPS